MVQHIILRQTAPCMAFSGWLLADLFYHGFKMASYHEICMYNLKDLDIEVLGCPESSLPGWNPWYTWGQGHLKVLLVLSLKL